MKRLSLIVMSLYLALCLTACCSSKTATQPSTKDSIPERNIKDPRIDSTIKPVEKASFDIKK